ncbi:ABC transporter permease [Puia dinghuensis]|uniref:ABC transporter permease n=1 Tax=Puia dinghuensis TaxID=1792502 RepID=A0A8J2U9D5_9BACT|nr:ABC transporter permease [Puia dinghuensis]GGA87230.1 ABC transporter permease [Puia dinghuensis]
MFNNSLTIAFRSLWRNKTISAIHILGLALGIATCLLIMLFVRHEWSYDRYNDKANRIVRVTFRGRMNGGEIKEANVMPPVAATLKKEFPEVQEATRLRANGIHRISYGTRTFREDAMAFVDSNFFQVFTLPLVKGDAATALLQPNTVIITRSVAEKYFGNEDPIGKVLTFTDDNAALTVTGVIEGVPENSHFHFDLFASMASLPEARNPSWLTSNYHTYLLLPEGYDAKKLEAKLPGVVGKYIGPQLQKAMGISLAQFRASGNNIGFFLQPLTDIHLHSDLTGDLSAPGDIHYIYIFSAVAIFMLLIACINFMNLSTAGATKRAKEVGIRKVLGSMRGQLAGQFLLESILLTTVAMVIALVLVWWALPAFNRLAGYPLSLHWSDTPWLLPVLLLFALATGLLAGAYPAFFLSGFRPVAVLKGLFKAGRTSVGLRSGLVVFQFFISISLIIGTVVVYRQLAYIQHKKLGYDRDQVLVVQDTYWLGNNQDFFRQQLLQDPRVAAITASGYLPAGASYNNNFLIYADNNSSQLVNSLRYQVDDSYIPTLGMEIADGRNFSKAFGTDSTAMIINETTARVFGWGRKAIGHTLTSPNNDDHKTTFHVIGVVKDFHFKSLHDLITPLVMTLGSNQGTDLIVKAKTRDIAGLLKTAQQKWTALKAGGPFSYSFLDQRFEDTYTLEQHIGRILGIFAGLTIFVACLGLLGLATFTAEQRTKEIGIRKVLGANTASIVALLSKDFLRLVVLAFFIAAPIAWIVMNRWLRDFAYRITIGWWVFVLAAGLAMLITVLTISLRAIRAARANPIESLRTE